MAPVVGGAVVSTILPLLTATILGYCITGYIRDVLFGRMVKKCIGPLCNILVSQLDSVAILTASFFTFLAMYELIRLIQCAYIDVGRA